MLLDRNIFLKSLTLSYISIYLQVRTAILNSIISELKANVGA